MKYLLIIIICVFTWNHVSAQQFQGHVYFPENVQAPLTQHEKAMFAEVFADNITFVTDKKSLLTNLKDLIRNRVKLMYIEPRKAQGSKKYRNATDLSSVSLYTTYNPNLQRDLVYNDQTFNILKYTINFFPKEVEIYKLGNHYISILPQKRITK